MKQRNRFLYRHDPTGLRYAAISGDILHVRVSFLKRWAVILWALALAFALVLIWPSFTEGAPEPSLPTSTVSASASPVPGTISTPVEHVRAPITGSKGFHVLPTWFGPECPTTWCRAHLGGEREMVVAINYAKFGRPKAVYIPQFDRTYAVVSNTDGKTDLDVFCDLDTYCQEQVAALWQTPLLINPIF